MAKISPASIKYNIYASFKAQGPLEKPDVIGAIFGQTEGLLGDELEMRELQKEGKIGRIEVDLEIVDGKSVGKIIVPSALDKSETTIIAAAFETIDKVGPTEAEIKVTKIEDVRGAKRDFIIDRAKALLESMNAGSDFEDMSKTVTEESRMDKVVDYGAEKLPAGDLSGNEVIVVEGRADVVNLLKNRVNNVIGMNGTKLPMEITRLGETKELTLFVDGDRGGRLIANNVINNARIKYVAVAPDGKEVEELVGKEILLALRKKVDVKEYLYRNRTDYSNSYSDSRDSRAEERPVEPLPELTTAIKEKIRSSYSKVAGTKNALMLDLNFDSIMKVSSREIARAVENFRGKVVAVVVDGSATATLIRICDEKGVSFLGATNFTHVDGARVHLISL